MSVEIVPKPMRRTSVTPYPLVFEPLYMNRVWGSRTLEQRFGRTLPSGPIGEAWDLVDRAEAVSRISHGPLQGTDLHTLWQSQPEWFLGESAPIPPLGSERRPSRFPLLLKLLDCRERLSVQVHPDEAAARALGGEAKSELWVVLETQPDAEIYAGLVPGVTRERFEEALSHGGDQVVPLLQRLKPSPGEALFMPAGCLHAIGAGVLLCEIQENSDTTFRVYDWDRKGLDGNPRPLHRQESLRCLNFETEAPKLLPATQTELLGSGPFRVHRHFLDRRSFLGTSQHCTVGVVLQGSIRLEGSTEPIREGSTFLLPAPLGKVGCQPLTEQSTLLTVHWSSVG